MWVIVCASIWISFPNASSARKQYDEYSEVVVEQSCNAPAEVTDQELEFMRSKEFKPMRIASLAEYDHVEKKPEADRTPQSEEPEEEHHPKCEYWWTHPAPHVYKLNQRCTK